MTGEHDRDGADSTNPDDRTVPSLRTPFGTDVLREGHGRAGTPSTPPLRLPRETELVDDRGSSHPQASNDRPQPVTGDTLREESPPAASPPGLALDGTLIADRYLLEHELGRGGMGTVYAGRHTTLGSPVAVKVLLPRFANTPHWLRRFEREARITSKLNHRNVVRVLDFGSHDGLPYLVMERLAGVTLSQWLFSRPACPALAEVEEIMLSIFDAFEAAHAAGVVHRDLKPDNVFLAIESDGRQIVKILDFGLAHMREPGLASLTEANMVSGTPEYMSPEQCRTLKVGPETDIYAMGCLLTEMLQLEPPFVGATHVDVMTKQMFYEPPALHRPPDAEPIPVLLERLRLDLLSKRSAQRPASVRDVKAAFLDAVSPEREAELLPKRKRAGAGGERAERAPSWEDSDARSALPRRIGGRVGLPPAWPR